MSDVVISYAQFLEYQERRRRIAVEQKLPERPQTIEPDVPTVPADTTPRQKSHFTWS